MGKATKVFTQKVLACGRAAGKDLGVNQPFRIPFCHMGQPLAISILSVWMCQLALAVDVEIVVDVRSRGPCIPESDQTDHLFPVAKECRNFVFQAVAVGVAILPRLARAARTDDDKSANTLMDDGIGLAMALTLPAAIALMVAPAYLIEGLYARGAFTLNDASQAGLALVHYGWGVPAFVLIKVLAPAYFAREDTKTPMRFVLYTVALNTVLGAGLFFWFKSQGWPGFPGLAIATSIAAWINTALLFFGLQRRGWYRPGSRLISRLFSVALASSAMGAALIYLIGQRDMLQSWVTYGKFFEVLAFIAIGATIYGIAAIMFGAVRMSDLKGAGRHKSA